MNAVPFDTLKFARRLEAAGATVPVAIGTAEALAEAMSGAELATKADIADVRRDIITTRQELQSEISATRRDLQTEIGAGAASLRGELSAFRAEVKAEFSAVRTEMKNTETLLRRDMDLLRRDLTIKLGSMIVVAVGVLITAIRYMPHQP